MVGLAALLIRVELDLAVLPASVDLSTRAGWLT